MVKVLFLDIDGVLNSEEVIRKSDTANVIAPKLVEKVNTIIRQTDCLVVITSTWRIYHNLPELKTILVSNGFNGTIIGVTPDNISKNGDRGSEIQDWLDANKEVKRFVILDDNEDMSVELKRYLVKTSWLKGIEDCHVDMAIKILNF